MRTRCVSKRYMTAYAALYGEQTELGVSTPPITKKKSPQSPACPTEVQEQVIAATWLSKMNIIFYHVPNGGYRDYLEAVKFKRMGVKAGVPDICIPIARKGHHGLYIELKRVRGSSISDTQKWWLDELKRQGYDVFVAKGAADLIEYVKNYMGV